jgi:8-oxo-dGTP diphosphatase
MSSKERKSKQIYKITGKDYNRHMKNTPKGIFEVTVDVVIFTIHEGSLKVLLGKRIIEPYLGEWSLPGGFIWEGETSTEASKRILKTKTNVTDVYLEQLYTFDDVKRDPRRRIITISYFALVPVEMISLDKSEEYETALFPVKKIPKLAFDHEKIIKYATKRLRAKLEYTNVAYSLLPTNFTLTELQKIYEIILGAPQDKRNFRRKYLYLDFLEKTNAMSGGKHRPAALYKFKKRQPFELKGRAF